MAFALAVLGAHTTNLSKNIIVHGKGKMENLFSR